MEVKLTDAYFKIIKSTYREFRKVIEKFVNLLIFWDNPLKYF